LAALQSQFEQMTNQLESSAAALKQVEAAKAEVDTQLAAAQAQAQEAQRLQAALVEKTAALSEAENKLKELGTAAERIVAMETKLAESEQARQVADNKAAEAEASFAALQQTITANSEKLKAMEGELSTAQETIKQLTDKRTLQTQADQVANLEQQIATLREQITALESGAEQMKKARDEAAAAAQAKTEEAQKAEQTLAALQAENQSLRGQLEQSQATAPQPAQSSQAEQKTEEALPASPVTEVSTPEQPARAIADEDGDGVADAADLCVASPAGSPVNALGCPAGKGIILDGVNFRSGTASFSPESQRPLDRVASALAQVPQLNIEVAGFTDSAGNAQLNLSLSKQRAQTIASYLASKGVATHRMVVKGYGQEKPIADNATAAGRQKNRRVELHPIKP
jgi:outer membrane protein OmpA-like peptidoglycan-associated protein